MLQKIFVGFNQTHALRLTCGGQRGGGLVGQRKPKKNKNDLNPVGKGRGRDGQEGKFPGIGGSKDSWRRHKAKCEEKQGQAAWWVKNQKEAGLWEQATWQAWGTKQRVVRGGKKRFVPRNLTNSKKNLRADSGGPVIWPGKVVWGGGDYIQEEEISRGRGQSLSLWEQDNQKGILEKYETAFG